MEAFTKTTFSFRYKPGDQVNLTCVCRATYPAANLSWFISGRKASPGWVLPTKVKIEQKSKLLSSHSQILMPPKDKAVVKCVASILVSTAMNYIYYLVLYPRFTRESKALEKNKISFHQVCFKCRYYHQSKQNTVQIIF